jgi:hypothetical protein
VLLSSLFVKEWLDRLGAIFNNQQINSAMRLICLIVGLFISLGVFSLNAQSSKEGADVPDRALDALIPLEGAWGMTTEQFETAFAKSRFDWLSPAKETARFFGPGLTIYGGTLKLSEAIVDFKDSKVARLSLSLFNRGDSAELAGNLEQFEKQVAGYRDAVSGKVGVKPTERKDRTSAVGATGFVWTKQPSAYLLEYSYQKEMKTRGVEFQPEFVRLRVVPLPSGGGAGAMVTSAPGAGAVSKASLVANVKKEENGDVLIPNVPMVDQGPKGYCVVATAERMFRYMGIPADQHEIAQAAGTQTGGGTSPDKMYEALNKLEGRLRFRMRVIEDWQYSKFEKMLEDYDREAKKRDQKEINTTKYRYTSLDDIYARIDGPTLKAVKTEKDKAGYGKFQRNVAASIDQGIPVMWSVTVGLLPEAAIPQGGIGGHMRLIIGYNPKTSEILYSDSWGAEHALKRMPMDQACAITNGMYYMEPMK